MYMHMYPGFHPGLNLGGGGGGGGGGAQHSEWAGGCAKHTHI